ncbi:MAG: VOC family protein [Dehalococcoidia bacterium]|nr:VOC family protein [Dehalococcoidia bacterium]MSQ34657.1 VOC family protein [Dehalococcoidia bacterium]
MPRFFGVIEAAIIVHDVKVALGFYVDVVGFEKTAYDVGPRAAIVKTGPRHYMGLWEPGVWRSNYLSPERNNRYFGQRPGQYHLVFGVHRDDVPALAGRLSQAGCEVDGPMPHGDGSPHLYLSDPDGHAVEFWGLVE